MNTDGKQNGVPTELTAPMSEWLASKGFQFLPVFVEEGLVYEGYGDFSQTPAVRVSCEEHNKTLNKDLIIALRPPIFNARDLDVLYWNNSRLFRW